MVTHLRHNRWERYESVYRWRTIRHSAECLRRRRLGRAGWRAFLALVRTPGMEC